jgi:hypothetical protein
MKAALKERLAGLSRGTGKTKRSGGYGNAEPGRLLVRAADQFMVKRRVLKRN